MRASNIWLGRGGGIYPQHRANRDEMHRRQGALSGGGVRAFGLATGVGGAVLLAPKWAAGGHLPDWRVRSSQRGQTPQATIAGNTSAHLIKLSSYAVLAAGASYLVLRNCNSKLEINGRQEGCRGRGKKHRLQAIAAGSFEDLWTKMTDPRRTVTNILIAANILMYIGQIVTGGRLTLWGIKSNSAIRAGQYWRLITCSFLHGGPLHIAMNMITLNNLGPGWEQAAGKGRFVATYAGATIASSLASFLWSRHNSLGASGGVVGLIGAFGVFYLRHQYIMQGAGQQALASIRNSVVQILLMFALPGIDNWGHVGGLLGGACCSWLLGPAFVVRRLPNGRSLAEDKPPLHFGSS